MVDLGHDPITQRSHLRGKPGEFGRGEDLAMTKAGGDRRDIRSAAKKAHMEERKVTVGEFREFVRRTAYITDCEKHDSGWIFVRRQVAKKVRCVLGQSLY
jgi:hypothetical protein